MISCSVDYYKITTTADLQKIEISLGGTGDIGCYFEKTKITLTNFRENVQIGAVITIADDSYTVKEIIVDYFGGKEIVAEIREYEYHIRCVPTFVQKFVPNMEDST